MRAINWYAILTLSWLPSMTTEAYLYQLNIMSENPEMQSQLVSSHGMLAILEVLEGRCSRDVIMKLLQIINLVLPFLP
jgi:hypothetical protein